MVHMPVLGVEEFPYLTASVNDVPMFAFDPSRLRDPDDLLSPSVGVGQFSPRRTTCLPSSPLVGTSLSAHGPSFQSRAVGVPQLVQSRLCAFRSPRSFSRGLPNLSIAPLGVFQPLCQEEEPSPPMRRADFSRRVQSRCNAVTQAFQIAGDRIEPGSQMPIDVLAEDEPGSALCNDACNMRP